MVPNQGPNPKHSTNQALALLPKPILPKITTPPEKPQDPRCLNKRREEPECLPKEDIK